MKMLRLFLVFITALLLLKAAPVHAASVIPYVPPVNLADSPLIISEYALREGALSYVQLFNTTATPVSLTGWRLEYLPTGQDEPIVSADLSGLIAPSQYIVVANTATFANADFGYTLDLPAGTVVSGTLMLTPPVEAEVAPTELTINGDGIFQRKKSLSTGNYLSTFALTTDSHDVYGAGFYDLPEVTGVQFSEILAHPRDCSPTDTALDCDDYVKFYNPTDQPINLSAFRLRFGYKNQNATASNAYALTGVVAPGHYATIVTSADNRPLAITNSGGYVWLEDTFGIKRYDETVQAYADGSSTSLQGQAWAYDASDDTWKWTTQPTPLDAASVFPASVPAVEAEASTTTLTPCATNQYRSPETNRCRLVTTATATLTPCKEGEYRSEATNRCRSIASAASVALVPCAPNQERSPTTSRCRNVTEASSGPAPCKTGQERNPATKRCKATTTTSVPSAAFAVEPIADTGKTFVGWWAVGGVGAVALGYGAWEWREEVSRALKKGSSFFRARK